MFIFFFLNDPAPTEIYTLSLHDALPIFLHEIGHVLIAEMKLPVLGREEDAADTYATRRLLLQVGTNFSLHALAEAARNWFLNERRDRETGTEPLLYGEHALNQQRAYHVV